MKRRLLATCLATLCGLAACSAHRQTAPTPTSPLGLLSATPLQYRDDVTAGRLQLQLTNGLGEALRVTAIRLEWAGFSSDEAQTRLTIGVGQRVDLPVVMQQPDCTIDGLAVQPAPSTDGAEVLLTLDDGTTRTATVTDPDGTLAHIHAAGCEREMITQQAPITFDDLHTELVDGRPLTVGVVRVGRGLARGDVTLLSAAGTIPFQLSFPARRSSDALLVLPAGEAAAEAVVYFTEGRCDAHAVAEAKQAFRFLLQVDLGDGTPRPLVVEPDAAHHEAMLATVADGCAALGLDGTLSPDG